MVLGGTILFLIVSIFHWQEIDLGIVEGGVSMWHGWGVLAGLLAIAIIVWEGLRLANMKIEIGLTPAMVTAALAYHLLLFPFKRFLGKFSSSTTKFSAPSGRGSASCSRFWLLSAPG